MAASKKAKVPKKAKVLKKLKVSAKSGLNKKSKTTQKPASQKAASKKSAAKKAPAHLAGELKAKKKTAGLVKVQKSSQKKVSTQKTATQKTNTQKKLVKVVTKSSANSYAKFFNPLDDRIVVDILPAPTQTAGGLFIPDSGQEKPERGVVVAVGPGKRNKKAQLRPLDVKIGDEVIFAKYAGTAIEILGKEVFILREDEVLGIVN
jgi:chaperonin GroES